MIIKQLSVFLENKTGRINEVTSILGEAGINMHAFSMAENSDFGILRVITSDVERAQEVLKKNHFAVTVSDVVCLNCPNTPGALSKALSCLSEGNVFIEYMYAFSMGDKALVVIRPNDIESCIAVLNAHQLELMAVNQFYKL